MTAAIPMKVLILTLVLAAGASAEATEPLSMTVSIADAHALTLGVKITWHGEAPLVINSAWLPWGSLYGSILLVATNPDPLSLPLESRFRIDDPMGKRITIRPGESLEGRIALKDRFPSIEEAVAKHDVVVFWNYQLRSVEGTQLPRLGGWVLIPKGAATGSTHH